MSDTIIDIHGLEIKKNSLYKIVHRPDKSAPSGFVSEGATKLPSSSIGNSITCRFVIPKNGTAKTGLYDTGFYEHSPCYSGMDKPARTALIKTLVKEIKDPYESIQGELSLDNSSNFWDDYLIRLHEGRVFNTSNPIDLLDLYIAMRSLELTPINDTGNPLFRDSQYCIVDIDEARNDSQTASNKFMDTISAFMALLADKKPLVGDMLIYLGLVGINDKLDDSTMKTVFYEWLNQDHGRLDDFNRVLKITESEQGIETLNLFALCRRLVVRKVINRTHEGTYEYNGKTLGSDIKGVAKNLVNDESLAEVKEDLLLAE